MRRQKKTSSNLQTKRSAPSRDEKRIVAMFDSEDRYPSDHFVLYADELSCVVYSETLYKALLSLPEKQLNVLLFDFWYAWTDEEIAERMEATTRTVYNLRQRAFKAIRYIDEDMKVQVQMKLVDAIRKKWRKLI